MAEPIKATEEDTSKISPAELKKRAKAEKQARRAAQRGDQATGDVKEQAVAQTSVQILPEKALPTRRRPSQSVSQNEKPTVKAAKPVPAPTPVKQQVDKQISLFSHLYAQPRRKIQDPIHKDVHPAVVSIGLQMSNFTLCGSSARCVAMMTSFKQAIQSYSTPKGTSLARHLTSHYLSPQIDFLRSCRPLSESMGNAIRFLKKRIIEIDPSVDDETAKSALCEDIDLFIRERIHITGDAIAETASKQIKDGAVLLVYAKSSLVEKTIIQARDNGTSFRVIVADSRPLFEGKSMARALMRAGIQVDYVPLSGVAQAIKDATLILLGAHSMLSNGRLQSRVGTAVVSMLAYKAGIPVIVCCESLKFSGKVALDSIVSNEVTAPEEVLTSADNIDEWLAVENLQPLNLLYDVTPAEYIRMVICEYGSLPSSSVPVVHRLANEGI